MAEWRWPHQYAAEILRLATPAERRAALDRVPEDVRGWVEGHVRDEYAKRKNRRIYASTDKKTAPVG